MCKLLFEACAQLSLLLDHVIMELVQGLVQTVDHPSIALAKGVAHLKVDVAKVDLFEKLVLKDTSGKASGTKNWNMTRR